MCSKRIRFVVGPVVAFALLLTAMQGPALAGKPGGRPDKGGGGDGPTYQILALDDADGAVFAIANDISNTGLVVGAVKEPVLDEEVAACWTVENTGGVITSSLRLLQGDGDIANGVNDLGEMVGHAFEVQDEIIIAFVARYWPSMDASPLSLPPLPGDSYSIAEEISNDGVVCGVSFGREGFGSSAVVWRVNVELVDGEPTLVVWGPLELPTLAPATEGPDTSFGNAISDTDSSGFSRVVGDSGPAAVAWTVESLADGTLAVGPSQILDVYGKGRSVNNDGVVCGTSFSQSETGWEALVWGGATQILARHRYVSKAHAHDINGSGVIVGEGSYQKRFEVGERAVVWTSETASMVLLDDFLSRNSPFAHLDRATAVNDSGAIVGFGSTGFPSYGAFLAFPE